MLSYWNSQDVIPGWAIARAQALAAQQHARESWPLTKAFLLGLAMATFYAVLCELVLR